MNSAFDPEEKTGRGNHDIAKDETKKRQTR